ncbi:hypothetical protein AOT95_17810 [Mycobacteroides sp. HXXIII]|nr:hypothetical protein AOT95_17810 [Mycobacteroides sp. HXXIII]
MSVIAFIGNFKDRKRPREGYQDLAATTGFSKMLITYVRNKVLIKVGGEYSILFNLGVLDLIQNISKTLG